MNYRYTLDPSPRKFICPACGKKRFVLYIDTETGEYLPDEFGRCDRESSCTYHNKPTVRDNSGKPVGVLLPFFQGEMSAGQRGYTPHQQPDFIPQEIFHKSLSHHNQNNFITILKTIFPPQTVKKLITDFFIGTSKYWPGATVFWQIDKQERIHAGNIMLFDSTTKKRVKHPYPHITWVHSVLIKLGKLKSFNLQQCLFGEHQLIDSSTDKTIALVESAKTAVIMSGIYPEYIWMATNGSTNINPAIFQPLFNRNIILYPDLGQFEKWNDKAATLIQQNFKITVSNLLEKNTTAEDHNNGLDIADYFISPLLSVVEGSRGDAVSKKVNSPIALSNDDKIFNAMASKYPAIIHLVNVLNLIDPNTDKPFHLVR